LQGNGLRQVRDVRHKGTFSQWADTIDWTTRCDWLQVASVASFNFYLAGVIVVVIRGRPKAEVLLSAENRNRNRKSIVSLMLSCQSPQATVPDADVDSAASFLGYLYIVSQYTVRLMTSCVGRILSLRNSSSVPYFRQPPNLPTAARRKRKCTECGTTAFGRNRMSAESAICPHSAPKPKPKFVRPPYVSQSRWS